MSDSILGEFVGGLEWAAATVLCFLIAALGINHYYDKQADARIAKSCIEAGNEVRVERGEQVCVFR